MILGSAFTRAAKTNSIILPEEATNAVGDSHANLFQTPVGQVYASTEFSSIAQNSILITEIGFRQNNPRELKVVIPRVQIYMGIFTGAMEELPDNSYPLAQELVFNQQNVSLRGRVPESLSDFPVRIRLDNPFLYDRQLGQLVMMIYGPPDYSANPVSFDATFISPQRGRYAFFNSDRVLVGANMIATEFHYTSTDISIQSIVIVSNLLQLDIKTPGEMIRLESAVRVEGSFSIVPDVSYFSLTTEVVRALVPLPGISHYYRVRAD